MPRITYSQLPFFRPITGQFLDDPAPPRPRIERTFETFSDGEEADDEEVNDEAPPNRPVAGSSQKRSKIPPSPPKRLVNKPSSPTSVPRIAPVDNLCTTLLSRKRGRDDDDEESEREVERSMGLEDEPASDESRSIGGPSGPLRILGLNRPLKRACERLRPTSDGGVEVYKYDEGPEYEARLEREAEVRAEWQQSSGHRTRVGLREAKGRTAV